MPDASASTPTPDELIHSDECGADVVRNGGECDCGAQAYADDRDGLKNGNRDLHEECQRLRASLDAETRRADDNAADYLRVRAELNDMRQWKSAAHEWCEARDMLDARCTELRAERDAMRAIVDTACAISDADLSVYDDVPEAHDLMNRLDLDVAFYRAEPRSVQRRREIQEGES